MSVHLLRFPVRSPELLRFGFEHGITLEDETLGYTLHAWLAALFGTEAPKPFRFFERKNEVLAYAEQNADALLERARAFASPHAWAALDPEGVVSKPLPDAWREGQRLHLEVLTCPVSRQDKEEKDVYLRALDRQGEATPPRAQVYQEWFIQQWGQAVRFDQVELLGMTARCQLLRRARNGTNRLRIVERPRAIFGAEAVITDPQRFAELLARGIGRHRAFGFGMVLLAPPR